MVPIRVSRLFPILFNAKPEAITRGFRAHKAKHREAQAKFGNLVMWQQFQEAGYREASVTN